MAVNLRTTRPRGAERLRMTVEEYLAFEDMSQEKHEYVDGWVYPLFPELDGMAGGTNNHAALTSNGPCGPWTSKASSRVAMGMGTSKDRPAPASHASRRCS